VNTDTDQSGELDQLLRDVTERARPAAHDGEVASYIPALADVDPEKFSLAAIEMDGTEHATGDADEPFPIQSISKVFALVLAMQKADEGDGVADELWRRVGREPSGDPYNSLVQLEREQGVPRNPMINAGSLIVDDVLLDHCDDARASMHELISELAGEEVAVDEEVLRSERDTASRNRAMANLMASFGNLTHEVDEVLDLYVDQCAISMNSRQLARAVRFLANDGVDPTSGRRLLSSALTRRVAAIMLTCGTYDAAGEFAFQVGLPCKSGVAGAIVALVPRQMGVCVWSPPLEPSGNSLAGRVALTELSRRLDLTIF
jgi:glutaminase